MARTMREKLDKRSARLNTKDIKRGEWHQATLEPGLALRYRQTAQGVGIWVGFQAFINMGVNLGALPTKGLTLPLMSYGGSAILMNLIAITVVLRIDYENKNLMRGGRA